MPSSDSETRRGASRENRPLRVLQLVSMLDNGGVERWIVDLCQAGRQENISMDIAVVWNRQGIFAARARERGFPIYECGGAGKPFTLMTNLRRLIREHGPYDAIHSHIHAFSGFALIAARLEGVPARLVHSHNVVGNSKATLSRQAYIAVAGMLIGANATTGLAPSAKSAEDLFGPGWQKNSRYGVLPCGIDLSPFRVDPDSSLRQALGIPPGALVLGSVGRLTAEKNSAFLVDVLAAALRLRSNTCLLLIGEGPLRAQMESQARDGGYSDRLILPGTRPDVPALMRGIMDVFVFPSPPPPRGNEALPIAVVEAQASGLPVVLSDGVPGEAVLVDELIRHVPVDASANQWAEIAIAHAASRTLDTTQRALAVIEASEHNCLVNIKTLAHFYRNQPRETSDKQR